MTEFFNRQEEKGKRRVLRQDQPLAEEWLWNRLRDRQVGGRKWRRQHGAGPYILDFYCPACRLAVELDGSSHDGTEAQAYDGARTEFLEAAGIQVLRFRNVEVFQQIETVLSVIFALSGSEA